MLHHDVVAPWQVAILEYTKKTSKWKSLTPTSNLTWLQTALRKFNSGADISRIWLRAHYNSFISGELLCCHVAQCSPARWSRASALTSVVGSCKCSSKDTKDVLLYHLLSFKICYRYCRRVVTILGVVPRPPMGTITALLYCPYANRLLRLQ
jgi:hypothetical protein